ncbi:LacI family DNA-binding transcriptional regulator [Antribacter gilvus]|uniref:LacI family DNA-binding transcriptional regulator n=1 Tax=Antribacter gilvus TaxID=2304675 RepID=UPI000F77E74C|nr:LacI family DNA-binding transcriptional regulator [Antribacter gilvus]
MSSRPSLKAVAVAAGVSPASVSNAYNRPEQLSAAARERILDLAAQMGYAGPHPSASSLRSRHSGSIGMLFAQDLTYAFDDPYCTVLMGGLAEIAMEAGANLLLLQVGPHVVSQAYSRDEELRLVQGARRAALDGAVADGVHPAHPVLRVLAERDVPVVSTAVGTGERCVLIDDRGSAVELGRHLRSLGHRRVVVVTDSMDEGDPSLAPADTHLFPYARLRVDGLREGLGGAEVTVVSAGSNTQASGRRVADLVLAMTARPTAVAATSDTLALGLLQRFREAGLEPGTGISVTGFDDVQQAGPAGLTTVRQPVREKGRTLGRMLLDPSFTETRVTLATELIIRTSTAPAP